MASLMQNIRSRFSSTFGGKSSGSSISASQTGMTNYGNSPTGSSAGQTNPMAGMTDAMPLLSSFGSLMSSGLEMYTANLAGKMKKRRLKMKARFEELEGEQILLNAEDEANSIRNQLLSDIASTDAFFAGRGVDIGSGTANQINIESRRRAGEDVNNVKTQAKRDARFKRVQAGEYRADGSAAYAEGRVNSTKAMFGAMKSGAQLYSGLNNGGLRGLLNG